MVPAEGPGWANLDLCGGGTIINSAMAGFHAQRKILGHRVHELLCGVARGPGHISCASAIPEGLVHGFAAVCCEAHHLLLVGWRQDCGMLHGAEQSHHHAQRIHGCLFPAEVGMPEVRYSAMRCLELLDQYTVIPLPSEVRCDETWAPVHLRHLVSEDIAIVVVACHAKATIRPTDNLHGGCVTDKVLQPPASLIKKACGKEAVEVVLLENLQHDLPETLLPLENSLLRDDVGHYVVL
mmetsp:Transcript_117477/g.251023  ORF Transcript_117477/g.251023 Transcript_117477/m.251023 type:complete len:238 (-) Transcript_117477:656-1369(-)